jgi:hypothetical protein
MTHQHLQDVCMSRCANYPCILQHDRQHPSPIVPKLLGAFKDLAPERYMPKFFWPRLLRGIKALIRTSHCCFVVTLQF